MPDPLRCIDAEMEGMTDAEKVEYLRRRLEDRLADERATAAEIASHLPVKSMSARVLAHLWERRNRITPYEILISRMEPCSDYNVVVDRLYIAQHIKRARRVLRTSDMPLEIVTHYDLGYCLRCPQDWQAPWDVSDH